MLNTQISNKTIKTLPFIIEVYFNDYGRNEMVSFVQNLPNR